MTAVVTSLGIVSCLGRGIQAHLEAVRQARSGIVLAPSFPPAAHVSQAAPRAAGIVDDALLSDTGARGEDRATRLALAAAADAIAGDHLAGVDPSRIGTIIGTGLGGITTLDAAYFRLYGDRSPRVHPMTVPIAMANAPTSAVARLAGARGAAFGIVSACTSATHAIAQAALWIRAGLADVVIAGGADSPIAEGIFRAWESLRVLAPAGDDPSTACRPFSADRQGLVLAEGAGIVIIEDSGHARRRGRRALASIDGVGMTSDAGHVTDPSSDGMAGALAQAVADSRINPDLFDYINAHGTATRANDPLETSAIHEVFGERARALMVSSTKAMHGHTMGASGGLELALTIASLEQNLIPPTLNLRQTDPACDLDYVADGPREASVRAFVSSSFGFGGLNGVIAGRMGTLLS